ncbi:LacI family DNA-binding transcriptional regulator [Actinoplanes sp. TFC3]|uniref:LacI family DNA-binding transcriptional regulator n=1 Tax=Actinoplanes sp. TFC3 TaxID=1710355 RepID=UPI001F3D2B77|nr:LacI family DNA-binding transcriptional regulator [Actinoplanes sp. TFC3]
MNDVARQAGVSLKTVSRVVNGETTVDPALAARVREAVASLGYRPNLGASLLRRADQRTGTIGLLLPDLVSPFSAALHRAIDAEVTRRGAQVLSGNVGHDPARERDLAETFARQHADGLIITPVAARQSHLAPDIPAVFVDRRARGWPADTVLATNHAGAKQAVEHLQRHGHRRIAYIGTMPGARRHGYRRAMAAAGLVKVERNDPEQALLEAPTALFTESRTVTVAAIRALQAAGMQRRVALVGFDDFPLADLLDPGITVVAQDPVAMGRAAARALFERIAGGTAEPRVISIPTTLIARGSGEVAIRGS